MYQPGGAALASGGAWNSSRLPARLVSRRSMWRWLVLTEWVEVVGESRTALAARPGVPVVTWKVRS